MTARRLYPMVGKRLLDLAFALPLFALLLPLQILLAMIIRGVLGSPVLFLQERIGLAESPFVLIKFRTMKELGDKQGRPLPDGDRLTKLGRFLRRMSLDELPSLLNVLKGDMSLIGPRPLLPEYLECYSQRERERHRIRPGLTGWAQVHGRNTVDWDRRLAMDVWYVENCTLALDVKIFLATIRVVIFGRGVAAPGHPAMPKLSDVRSAGKRLGRASTMTDGLDPDSDLRRER